MVPAASTAFDLAVTGGQVIDPEAGTVMSAWLACAMSHDGHDPNPTGGVRPAVREFQDDLRRQGHTPDQMAPRAGAR